MQITKWKRPSRSISRRSARAFFDQPLRETSLFLFETASLDMTPHKGAFSLKLVLSGEEKYFIGNRAITLTPGDLLFLNAGETYASSIDRKTRSLSLFYSDDEAEAAKRSVLDASGNFEEALPTGLRIDAPQIRFKANGRARRAIRELVRAGLHDDEAGAEEGAAALLGAALGALHGVAPINSLGYLRRRATRDELLCRVRRARERIIDQCGDECSLDSLAATACLSKFHFLRIFKEAFGETPARLARRLRLNAASAALANGDEPEAVAKRKGYASAQALTRALASSR